MIALLRRNRAIVALALLLVVGAVVAQVAADRDHAEQGPTLSSRNAGPEGSLALALWLESLGYRVSYLEGNASSPNDTVRYLFILRPTARFTRSDARAVVEWIRRGGTLVYVPNLIPTFGAGGLDDGDGLSNELDVRLRLGSTASGGTGRPTAAILPFFTTPPGSRFVDSGPWTLSLQNGDWVPLIGAEPVGGGEVVVAERRYGGGRVYAVASGSMLDNAHLGQVDNASLILNLLARGADDRAVAFDEYHNGVIAPPDLTSVVRASPWGWALIYAGVLTFCFALWSGRRFGPPIVRPRQPGRSAADYVTAFAGLLQRRTASGGAAIDWAQTQYARLIRRELARAHGVRADLPAGDLARILAERRPIGQTALAEHVTALDGPPLGEKRLLAELRELEPILRVLVPPTS